MNLNDKHIVIITPGFPANEADLNCIPPLQLYILELIKNLKGIRISIVTMQYPFYKKPYTWNGCAVFPCYFGKSKWKSPFKWRKAVVTIDQLNKKYPVDLVHCFWYTETALVGKKVNRKFGLPVLVTLMGQDSKKKNQYLKLVKFKVPKIVALSEIQKLEFKKSVGIDCLDVIPWGIPQHEFYNENDNRENIILGVGSLVPIKNYPLFIDVIEELYKTRKDFSVIILGGGFLQKQLSDLITSKNLNNVIKLKGEVSRNEVLNQMRESKVLLHTSHSESQGYVFYEAQVSGMQIVSTKVGVTQQGENWRVGSDKSQLAALISQSFSVDASHGVNIPTMSDTVERYCDIYSMITQE